MPSVRRTPLTQGEKETRVRVLIRQLIIHVDPNEARIVTLANKIGVTRQYISMWITSGRVPFEMARKLNRLFGSTLAPVDELCWPRIS